MRIMISPPPMPARAAGFLMRDQICANTSGGINGRFTTLSAACSVTTGVGANKLSDCFPPTPSDGLAPGVFPGSEGRGGNKASLERVASLPARSERGAGGVCAFAPADGEPTIVAENEGEPLSG